MADGHQNMGGFKLLLLDEQKVKTLPTAVIYNPQDKITLINEQAILGTVTLADIG